MPFDVDAPILTALICNYRDRGLSWRLCITWLLYSSKLETLQETERFTVSGLWPELKLQLTFDNLLSGGVVDLFLGGVSGKYSVEHVRLPLQTAKADH